MFLPVIYLNSAGIFISCNYMKNKSLIIIIILAVIGIGLIAGAAVYYSKAVRGNDAQPADVSSTIPEEISDTVPSSAATEETKAEDELPFKKISSHNSWSPTKSSSCWTGDIFFCAACSVPPVLRLHPRPKEQFFLFPPPKATFPAPSASPTHFRVSK